MIVLVVESVQRLDTEGLGDLGQGNTYVCV